jgi:hypothetical protein
VVEIAETGVNPNHVGFELCLNTWCVGPPTWYSMYRSTMSWMVMGFFSSTEGAAW